jgi:hypothetical protein
MRTIAFLILALVANVTHGQTAPSNDALPAAIAVTGQKISGTGVVEDFQLA